MASSIRRVITVGRSKLRNAEAKLSEFSTLELTMDHSQMFALKLACVLNHPPEVYLCRNCRCLRPSSGTSRPTGRRPPTTIPPHRRPRWPRPAAPWPTPPSPCPATLSIGSRGSGRILASRDGQSLNSWEKYNSLKAVTRGRIRWDFKNPSDRIFHW